MNYNWITIISIFLLVAPLVTAFWRGLPEELHKSKYTIRSFCSSIVWILSYVVAYWALRAVVKHNGWQFPQLQWIQQQLNSSMLAWAIAVPVAAIVISWFLGIFVEPVIELLLKGLQPVQGWAARLSKGTSRFLAVCLQTPRAVLHTLIFLIVVHIALPYVQSPSLQSMANSSPLYQMADSKIIEPVLSSSFTKRLPVLGQQAGNWYNTITQEAVKTGPADGKAFLTWQTRFASNAEIDDTAKSVVQGATSDREKALKLYQWIGSHITYDDTKAMLIESGRYQTLTFGAVPTFQTRKGVCSDYSSLMVAMGRAIGLEVQQEVGMGVLPDGSSGPHAWNVVYLKDENKRIPCDPTWEQAGNFFDNRDFYETHHPDKLSI